MSFKFSCYRHEPPPFSDQTYRQTVGQHAGSDVQSQNMPENGENGQTTPKTYMYKIMGGGTLRIHTYTHTCTHNNKHFWFKPCQLRQVQEHPRGPPKAQPGRKAGNEFAWLKTRFLLFLAPRFVHKNNTHLPFAEVRCGVGKNIKPRDGLNLWRYSKEFEINDNC